MIDKAYVDKKFHLRVTSARIIHNVQHMTNLDLGSYLILTRNFFENKIIKEEWY